jgi:CDP-paratose 2-epimerase
VTGGAGFLGSNLAAEVLARGQELAIIDGHMRKGCDENLTWLKSLGSFQEYIIDIRDNNEINKVFEQYKPDIVFHVAGQVAMTTSLENPRRDFETNALGTFNILEAVKNYSPNAKLIYSSTNKVYGDLEHLTYLEGESRYTVKEYPEGMPESIGLDFTTPYGCSKGCADQYIQDWARCYDLNTVVFRHSSIFGGRQFSTFDQGWIGWFVDRAIKTKRGELDQPFTIAGNGKQVRDVLFAEDLVKCYFSALEKMPDIKGEVFNIGGGFENSLSLLELFQHLEELLDIKLNYTKCDPRKSDQKVFIADVTKAQKMFGWRPTVDKVQGLKKMISWVESL